MTGSRRTVGASLRRALGLGPVIIVASTMMLGVGAATGAPVLAPVRWHPLPGVSWQWQLDGPIDTTIRASVYDVDLFETSKATVARLHALRRKVVCYFSAGSLETGRPDYFSFPRNIIGLPVDGWPQERWLDIRATPTLAQIMGKRMDLCKAKGFNGVEADLVDGYQSRTGFPLTAAQQLKYDRMLAAMAHARGLAIGLKNDLDQAVALEPSFDFAVNEQCFEYAECGVLSIFIRARKPVSNAEYNLKLTQFCPAARSLGFASILKQVSLGAWRRSC